MSNRKSQKLINFHSSGSSNVPLSDLNYGEIAVRHRTNPGESQLIIKTSDNTSAIFVESAGVVSMINQSIAGVAGNVTEIAQSLSAVSATAVSTQQTLAEHIVENGNFYAEVRNNLSASVVSDINNLANNYYNKTDIDGKVETINNNATAIDNRVTSLSSATQALSGAVSSKYATKDYVNQVSGDAITIAKNYTNQVSGNIATTLANNYYTTGQIDTKVTTINNNVTAVDTRVTNLSGAVEAFSSSVVTNYAKKTDVAAASANAITSAKAYTDSQINALSGNVNSKFANYYTTGQIDTKVKTINNDITAVGTRVTNLSGATQAFSSSVVTNYAKKTEVATASANAITSAKAYTDSQINALSGNVNSKFNNYYTTGQIDTKVTTINNDITAVGTRVTNLSGATKNLSGSVVSMSASVKSYIDDKLSVVYKFRGSVPTYADLTSITNKQNGDVYNVEAAQGTMGEPGYVPAGTNYAWNATGNTWDALGGTIDLSIYATSADTANLQQEINSLGTNLSNLSGHVKNMTTNYATTAQVATASANAVTSAINYTNSVSANIATTLTNGYYTKGQIDTKVNTINNNVTAVDTRVTSLSSATEAFSSSVVTNYAKKTDVAAASANAITSAKAYTDSQITALSGNVNSKFNNYYTTGQIDTKVTTINNDITAVGTRVTNLSGATQEFSSSVVTNYAKKTEVATASANAVTSAINYTNSVSANIATTLTNSYYTKGDIDGKVSTINNNVTAVGTRVTNLSGAVETLSAQTKVIETKANNALNEFKLGTVSTAKSEQFGAKATYTAGGAGILDLTSLVIDCGTW